MRWRELPDCSQTAPSQTSKYTAAMSFPSSTPSLWDQRPSKDVVHKFATMAVASPHGVEGLATGALSPPPPSHSDQAAERITELARYFFKEIVRKAMTYMEHDRFMSYRTKHLVFALEQFATEVKQQQMLPEYLENATVCDEDKEEEAEWKEDGDNDGGNDEKADEDTMKELVEMEREDDEEAMDEEQQDGQAKEEVAADAESKEILTRVFDDLFPPVADASFQCLSREILAKTWNDTGIRFYRSDLDVHVDDQDAFYGKLNDSINAYIATMLLEPRSLDSAFAKVDN